MTRVLQCGLPSRVNAFNTHPQIKGLGDVRSEDRDAARVPLHHRHLLAPQHSDLPDATCWTSPSRKPSLCLVQKNMYWLSMALLRPLSSGSSSYSESRVCSSGGSGFGWRRRVLRPTDSLRRMRAGSGLGPGAMCGRRVGPDEAPRGGTMGAGASRPQ